MIGRLALLAVVAVSCAAAAVNKPEYQTMMTADKDFLLKQKKVYQMLFHVNQPELLTDMFKEGQEWNMEANMGSYTNETAVKAFMHQLEHGFLPHNAIFSIYYPKNMKEAMLIFRVLYYAKDFDTFYKTALFCRNRMNHSMFAYAFYLAVIQRPDTKYIQLPPIYELTPYLFFNTELLEKAHHYKEFGKMMTKQSESGHTFNYWVIPYNYSGHYISDEYDYEQRVNYFTEDIGLNNYYFFFRNQFPFFMSSDEFNWPSAWRGEEYLYGHKQLFNRYYLERLSNDLGKIEDYDYDKPFFAGFYPSMTYPNGFHFPSRPWDSNFPKYKFHTIHQSEEYESRIAQAVDSGMIFTKEGKAVKIYTPEGLNMLGNLIEGNGDSPNEQYYGNIDMLGRNILGFNVNPITPDKPHPSALEHFSSSMRDPAFWRLYKKIFHFYYKYKINQKPYKPEEIQFPDLKIESVEMDKLMTYFDAFEATISRALVVENMDQAKNLMIQASQNRLNHKNFNMQITINAEKPTKAAIRIFLGPKYTVHMNSVEFKDQYNEFYELDNFIYDLSAGANKIERNCHDFLYVDKDPKPSEEHWMKLMKAIEGGEELKLEKRIMAFPQRLLLPKGKPEGMPFQLFIHVAPVNGEPMTWMSRVFGEALVDKRAMGYPLDRPINELEFHGPNFFMKDVMIYHKNDVGPNMSM